MKYPDHPESCFCEKYRIVNFVTLAITEQQEPFLLVASIVPDKYEMGQLVERAGLSKGEMVRTSFATIQLKGESVLLRVGPKPKQESITLQRISVLPKWAELARRRRRVVVIVGVEPFPESMHLNDYLDLSAPTAGVGIAKVAALS